MRTCQLASCRISIDHKSKLAEYCCRKHYKLSLKFLCVDCGKTVSRKNVKCVKCYITHKPFEFITNNQGRKVRLVTERGWKCEGRCGLSEWFGEPIPLEVDHIDGNHSNTKKENFRLLCPNCHVFTPTYKGKNGLRNYCRQST